jgi:peroxiredoxin
MASSAQSLIDEKVGKDALKEGDKLPDFTLTNAKGEAVNIYQCLEDGPLIINFYRGAWCPYCNLELKAYKDILPEIKEAGANLIAISPELPDTSLSLVEKHQLEFEVLSDVDNKYAKSLGLVFALKDELKKIYKDFGHDLDKAQGNSRGELPIPATYVVDRDGTVLLASVNTNYTKRLEPRTAIEALKLG